MPERMSIGLLPEMLDSQWIRAEKQRFEIPDRSDHRMGLARKGRFPDPDQSLIRFDPDEEIVPPFRSNRHCLQCCDPHRFPAGYVSNSSLT